MSPSVGNPSNLMSAHAKSTISLYKEKVPPQVKMQKIIGTEGGELEWSQIPCLREPRKKSPEIAKREQIWDNRCYRISMINSVVHSHYRTLFEQIAVNKKM